MSDISAEVYRNHIIPCWSTLSGMNPVEVARTQGCYIYTKDGRKIFDLRSAHESANIGFNHPHVLEAMQLQMQQCSYVTDDFATDATANLTRRLCELTPGTPNKRVWFGQSGAACVEAAIKAARFYKYRQMFHENRDAYDPVSYPYPYKILSRYRSWHGATAGALSASGDPRRWFAEPLVQPGVIFGPDVYPFRSPLGDDPDGLKAAAYMRHMIEMEGGREYIAAILVEPVVGSNGIIPAPVPYMRAMRDLCDEFDLVMIVDETMTGMGRTGTFLAIEQYDVTPDIIIMGKALGMYCPLAATIMTERIWKTFEHTPFGHGQSYSGHALGCAAALAGIEVLEQENLLEHAREMGQYLQAGLEKLRDKHISVGEVRGVGLMYTMELVLDRETKQPVRKFNQKYAHSPVKELASFLLDQKNIYIPSDKFGLWITPPLIVTQTEIDTLLDAFDQALAITDKAAKAYHEDYQG